MTDKTDQKPSLFFSGSLYIFASSALGYIAMFFYEYGYCSFFNIPASLIEVSLIRLAVFFPLFISVLMFGYMIIEGLGLYKFYQRSLGRKVIWLFLLLLISIILGDIFDLLSWPRIISILLFPFLFFLNDFVFPVIHHRDIKGIIERIERMPSQMGIEDTFMVKVINKHIGINRLKLIWR